MRKRPAWSWADYHREEKRRHEPPPSGFLQLLLPHLQAMTPDEVKALALRAGLAPSTLHHWLSGRIQHGNSRTIGLVAGELGYELVERPKPHLLRIVK